MKSLLTMGMIAAAIMALPVTPAQAQGAPCAPRASVLERLAQGYGESRKSIGLGANNQVVEIFASDVSGTWTITVTNPAGVTCMVASGRAFETLADAVPDTSDPA